MKEKVDSSLTSEPKPTNLYWIPGMELNMKLANLKRVAIFNSNGFATKVQLMDVELLDYQTNVYKPGIFRSPIVMN